MHQYFSFVGSTDSVLPDGKLDNIGDIKKVSDNESDEFHISLLDTEKWVKTKYALPCCALQRWTKNNLRTKLFMVWAKYLMELYWRDRPLRLAFILEWQVALVAALGQRGRAEAQLRQEGQGRRAICWGSSGRLDGTAAAQPLSGGQQDRQNLQASWLDWIWVWKPCSPNAFYKGLFWKETTQRTDLLRQVLST